MTHQHILICLFLLAMIPMSATAFPPASPAGGNYLTLDGVDDYAVLDFKTHGVLFPKDTEEFTVEMWVYPTTPPAGNVYAMILSQQVRMEVASDNGHWENVKEHIEMSAKMGLRRVINLKKTGTQSRCGILMNPVEDGTSQMPRVTHIIWWVKVVRVPASHSQLNPTENSQRHGDD